MVEKCVKPRRFCGGTASKCSQIHSEWHQQKYESLRVLLSQTAKFLPSFPSSFPYSPWKCEISWNMRTITRRPSIKTGGTGKINWSQTPEQIWFTLQSLLWTPANVSPRLDNSSLSSFMFTPWKSLHDQEGRDSDAFPSFVLPEDARLSITPQK